LESLDRSMEHAIYFSKAELDSFIKTLTMIYVGLVLLLIIISYMFFIERKLPLVAFTILLVIALALLIYPYMYSPKKYVLTARGVIIETILKTIFIPYSKIVNVKLTSTDKLFSAYDMEIWASNGYCGIFGEFKLAKLGYVHLYITKLGKCILIETSDNVGVVISPSKVLGFYRIIREYVKLRGNMIYFHNVI